MVLAGGWMDVWIDAWMGLKAVCRECLLNKKQVKNKNVQ
jgi:hypothetical protein